MSLQILEETGNTYDPVFLKILEDIPGGVTIKSGRFPSTTKEIKKGALLNADSTTAGLYNLVKTAKLKRTLGTSACVTVYIYPGQEFIAGEYIGLSARGSAATIASITRATGTDIIIFTAGGGGFNSTAVTGTLIDERSAASIIPTISILYAASAILKNTLEVRRGGVTTILDNLFASAVVRGTVDESELPYFVTSTDKTALTARIRFA